MKFWVRTISFLKIGGGQERGLRAGTEDTASIAGMGLAAEIEEKEFYEKKAPKEWLEALKPLGTDKNKSFLEEAPYLIAVFEKKHSIKNKKKVKNYYVKESVGIATGILISVKI